MDKRIRFNYFGVVYHFMVSENFGNSFVVAKDYNQVVYLYRGYYKDLHRKRMYWFSEDYVTTPKPKKKLSKELEEVDWKESLKCYVITGNVAKNITPEKSELLRLIYG